MLRSLTSEELRTVYHEHMKVDFPPQERKPLERIEAMRKQGEYECCGLFEEGELRAYALIAEPKDTRVVLLDYLAAVRDRRSLGYGSLMLKLLGERYTDRLGLLIEAEDPAFSGTEEERRVRTRRIEFYERNKAVQTGVYADVFGTDYTVLFLPSKGAAACAFGRDEAYCQYEKIYKRLVPFPYYEKNVHLFSDVRI